MKVKLSKLKSLIREQMEQNEGFDFADTKYFQKDQSGSPEQQLQTVINEIGAKINRLTALSHDGWAAPKKGEPKKNEPFIRSPFSSGASDNKSGNVPANSALDGAGDLAFGGKDRYEDEDEELHPLHRKARPWQEAFDRAMKKVLREYNIDEGWREEVADRNQKRKRDREEYAASLAAKNKKSSAVAKAKGTPTPVKRSDSNRFFSNHEIDSSSKFRRSRPETDKTDTSQMGTAKGEKDPHTTKHGREVSKGFINFLEEIKFSLETVKKSLGGASKTKPKSNSYDSLDNDWFQDEDDRDDWKGKMSGFNKVVQEAIEAELKAIMEERGLN